MDTSSEVQSKTAPPPPDRPEDRGKKISKKYLVNKLNYINFQNQTINVVFKHSLYKNSITIPATPLPCGSNELHCAWAPGGEPASLQNFEFSNLCVADGQKLIVVSAEVIKQSRNGISFLLPETSFSVNQRRTYRHYCKNVQAQLIQNGVVFQGWLLDFSGASFKVELFSTPPQSLHWINVDQPVNILFLCNSQVVYSGECAIKKHSGTPRTKTFVLTPLHSRIQRFSSRETRSTRHRLVPSPRLHFKHPLTNTLLNLEIFDVSGSGFSVDESLEKTVLLPGLILTNAEFCLSGSFNVICTVQVVHKSLQNTAEQTVARSGLSILDIDPNDHVKILGLVQQVKDKDSYVCNKVTAHQLWNFFFDTGFIYPEKYLNLEKHKEKLKNTLEKLYEGDLPFARHFVYQQDDRIDGHMSMLRFYNKTWLIHHHASRKNEHFNAGLDVLNSLSRSIIDCHTIFSAHMNYLACYYRPDNKFPNRIFGGVAKYINDRTACSVDTFAYLKMKALSCITWGTDKPGWIVGKLGDEELKEFKYFYDSASGGLLIPAFDLDNPVTDKEPVSEAFEKAGLRRERHFYSIKKNGSVKAVIILTVSELGLNLSDLTNCLKVFVTDCESLPITILHATLLMVVTKHSCKEAPILIYPASYAVDNQLAYEKLYNLFIIDTAYSDPYFKYLKNFFRFSNYKQNEIH
ncbi:PilZ domain-containing protein [Geobacter sp. DSM 9736]|uniref:PilZ domain-containing protein n=1 Tax=Geobacter sp. DSM 9736 TaxID=1277350 RepID=UPI000B5F97C1|nr:PilZ domain-containing protein [Geobacter sp. DSM 9736]SNB47746.1 hypothetical protein SAMN06269301_3238 [Geobacter sp. DSM 9736]